MKSKKESKIKALHAVSDYSVDLVAMYKKHNDVMSHNMRTSLSAEMSFMCEVRKEIHKDIYGETK